MSSLRKTSDKKAESHACETCRTQYKTNHHLEQHKLGKYHLAEVNAQQSGSRITVIFVGRARKRYEILHEVLYNASPYFRELCDNRAKSVQESSFRIGEECGQFGIFIYCLNNQDLNIPTPIGVVPALLELYFIAAKYQVSFLQDRILDHLLIMKRCLQEWNIKRLYKKTNATSKLRWLCACDATCLLRSSAKEIPATQDSIEYKLLEVAKGCSQFVFDVFRVQLIYDTCNWPKTYMNDFHACEFHCHEPDRPCYHVNFDGTPRLPGSFVNARNLDGALRDSSNGGVLGKRQLNQNDSRDSIGRSVKRKIEEVIVKDEESDVLQE